jgi:hypothetical protein
VTSITDTEVLAFTARDGRAVVTPTSAKGQALTRPTRVIADLNVTA